MSTPQHVSFDFDGIKGHKLSNSKGVEIVLIDYGATITSIKIPSNSVQVNIALGYDNLKGYEEGNAYFGCSVGRVCNRIAKGAVFRIN